MTEKLNTEIPVEEAEFSVLDFETTGTSARTGGTIEIGLVKVEKMKIADTYQSFINPGTRIPYFITNLTGITDSDVVHAPKFPELIDEIKEFIGSSVLVAHNLQFDYSFLREEFSRAGVNLIKNETLCTLKLARKLHPDLKSKSLGNLVKHFRITHKNVHRALGDSTVTAKLLIKFIKEATKNHGISTLSELLALQSTPGTRKTFKMIKKKLAEDLNLLPNTPGIYLFNDKKETVIYVGKAKHLRQRVNNYFTNTAARKAKKIVRRADGLKYISTNSELTALLAEAEFIKELNPVFNSQLKRYPQQFFVKVDLSHPFPDVKVSTKFDFDGNDYFGPFPNREAAKLFIEVTNRSYQIRECKDKEFKKGKKCYLADIERCLAPCIEETEMEYSEELKSAYQFLAGQNQSAVDRLLGKMKKYSEDQRYEEAAETRDVVQSLLQHFNRSAILAEPINSAKILIKIKDSSDPDYIILIEGKMFIKRFPNNGEQIFFDALEDYFDGTKNLFYELTPRDLERLKISLSWLVKNRNLVKIYYLKEYDTKEELLKLMG